MEIHCNYSTPQMLPRTPAVNDVFGLSERDGREMPEHGRFQVWGLAMKFR